MRVDEDLVLHLKSNSLFYSNFFCGIRNQVCLVRLGPHSGAGECRQNVTGSAHIAVSHSSILAWLTSSPSITASVFKLSPVMADGNCGLAAAEDKHGGSGWCVLGGRREANRPITLLSNWQCSVISFARVLSRASSSRLSNFVAHQQISSLQLSPRQQGWARGVDTRTERRQMEEEEPQGCGLMTDLA